MIPKCPEIVRKWYSELGKRGGKARSARKTIAARENAKQPRPNARGPQPGAVRNEQLHRLMEELGCSRQWAHEILKRGRMPKFRQKKKQDESVA